MTAAVTTPSEEAEMLAEALGVASGRVRPLSREPLGEGTVAGLEIIEDDRPLLYYLDTSRLAVAQETGMASPGDPPEARIWLHPADPHLPALPAVAFARAASSLLARAGVAAAGDPQLVSYRPGRRAVLRVDTADDRRVWIKVVRPHRARHIADAHSACARASLPVPVLRAWSPEGVLVIDDAAGTPAADVIWNPSALLDEVDALRRRIAEVRVDAPTPGVAGRLDWYAPRLAPRPGAARVADVARSVLARASRRDRVVVHGDLHFGQLFLDEQQRICSVIDVDTLGRGDPAEDPAAFLAHAATSALLTHESSRDRVWQLANAALERWGDDEVVRALASVHLLGHALGASDRRDLAMCDQLIGVAETVLLSKRPLIGA